MKIIIVWKVSFDVLDVLVSIKSSLSKLFECVLSFLGSDFRPSFFSDIPCGYLMQGLTQM